MLPKETKTVKERSRGQTVELQLKLFGINTLGCLAGPARFTEKPKKKLFLKFFANKLKAFRRKV